MKGKLTREEIKAIVDEKIELFLKEIHQVTGIIAGDMSPAQTEALEEVRSQLIHLITTKFARNQKDDE